MQDNVNKNIYHELVNYINNSNYDEFISFLYKNHSLINVVNDFGEGLLHACCLTGEIEKYEALINIGCTIYYTKKNNSLLHYATYSSADNYLITELIKKGFSPLFKNNDGETPIHYGGNNITATYYSNWLEINRINPNTILDYDLNTFSHSSKKYKKIDSYNMWSDKIDNNILNIYGKKASQMKTKTFKP